MLSRAAAAGAGSSIAPAPHVAARAGLAAVMAGASTRVRAPRLRGLRTRTLVDLQPSAAGALLTRPDRPQPHRREVWVMAAVARWGQPASAARAATATASSNFTVNP